MKLLFIHRSVGQGIIDEGRLRSKLDKLIEFDDFNSNTHQLTSHEGVTSQSEMVIPGDDTTPKNLDTLFSEWSPVLDAYDLVAIKSCYPNSRIKNDAQLAEIERYYSHIIDNVVSHGKRLLIITTPPLRPSFTNAIETMHADELAKWLMEQRSDAVSVFDLRSVLSENGVLKSQYRRFLPWDNHPNTKGYQKSADSLAEHINMLAR